jgi:hypothetical protein
MVKGCVDHAFYLRIYLIVRATPAVTDREVDMVHQGGGGTMDQALHSGPRCSWSCSPTTSQTTFAGKILCGARFVYARSYSARRVAGHLRVLLEKPGYRDRAGEDAKQVQSEDVANEQEQRVK